MNIYIDNPQALEIYSRLKKVITEVLKVSEEKIQPESSYIEDFGADSLDRVTLVMELEDEFGKEIPEKDAAELKTVGATMEYILNRI